MNIYTYTHPEIYLKDMLAAKKEKNPQFSLRAWARLLGMKTHTPLQLMLASKRPIPKKYIPLFGKSLSLTDEEVLYLEAMIDHQRARKEADKLAARTRMLSIQRTKFGADQAVEETLQPTANASVNNEALPFANNESENSNSASVY